MWPGAFYAVSCLELRVEFVSGGVTPGGSCIVVNADATELYSRPFVVRDGHFGFL